MRLTYQLLLFILVLALAYSCTSPAEEEALAPDASNLITGSYSFTTSKNGSITGSGRAAITKEGINTIRIGLEDGVSFYANQLQRIDDDLVMTVPNQQVDYYNMDAQFSGRQFISRGNIQYHGVYTGSNGELNISLQVVVGNQTDQILLVLKR